MSQFTVERNRIATALTNAGIGLVLFNKDTVPREFPCAVVILENETGKLGTTRQFLSTELAWTVFLVVNAHDNPDPDSDLFDLKEHFRAAWINGGGRDFPKVEYYSSRVDGARAVRIARIELGRRPA